VIGGKEKINQKFFSRKQNIPKKNVPVLADKKK